MNHPRIPRPRGHILGQSWPGMKLRIHTQPTRWQRLVRWLRAVVTRFNRPAKGLL